MLITLSFKKSLIVEQFQGNYLKVSLKLLSSGMWRDLVVAKEVFFKFTTMEISEPHPGQM